MQRCSCRGATEVVQRYSSAGVVQRCCRGAAEEVVQSWCKGGAKHQVVQSRCRGGACRGGGAEVRGGVEVVQREASDAEVQLQRCCRGGAKVQQCRGGAEVLKRCCRGGGPKGRGGAKVGASTRWCRGGAEVVRAEEVMQRWCVQRMWCRGAVAEVVQR